MMNSIKVNYKATEDLTTASTWIDNLQQYKVLACDFETAIRYTEEDLLAIKKELENSNITNRRKRLLQSVLNADALSHPSHTRLTHFSVAWSQQDAYVFIIDSIEMQNLILNFLVSTFVKQVWHNFSFDGKHIYYYTNKFPIDFEDSQILAKTILNHTKNYKSKTGLKELAGYHYGNWGISSEYFSTKDMREEKVLKYAATDACATFFIWNQMQELIK